MYSRIVLLKIFSFFFQIFYFVTCTVFFISFDQALCWEWHADFSRTLNWLFPVINFAARRPFSSLCTLWQEASSQSFTFRTCCFKVCLFPAEFTLCIEVSFAFTWVDSSFAIPGLVKTLFDGSFSNATHNLLKEARSTLVFTGTFMRGLID